MRFRDLPLIASAMAVTVGSLPGHAPRHESRSDRGGPGGRGAWTTIPLLAERRFHTARVLGDGRVLVAGGTDPAVRDRTIGLRTTEVYDPPQRRFVVGPALPDGRVWHSAVRLANSVLIAGGLPSLSSALLVDQTTFEVRSTSPMLVGRQMFTMVALLDGTALVFGGGGPGRSQAVELYDSERRVFERVGDALVSRFGCPATVLKDGRVLLTGGVSASKVTYNESLVDAELYDPSTKVFTRTGSMNHARTEHSATLLADGRVLVAGGHTDSAELYDPGRGTFRQISPLSVPRSDHAAVRLLDGRVLIIGGAAFVKDRDVILDSVELFDPTTETFSPAQPMNVKRQGHTASLLSGGDVLVVGGGPACSEGAQRPSCSRSRSSVSGARQERA